LQQRMVQVMGNIHAELKNKPDWPSFGVTDLN
jgi:hypothetical protein